uniref:Uncharacterized protein n=1 Tax=Cacopsylla melanoneura TaxID=428564 RepID=A0A8D8VYH0_9HEMI
MLWTINIMIVRHSNPEVGGLGPTYNPEVCGLGQTHNPEVGGSSPTSDNGKIRVLGIHLKFTVLKGLVGLQVASPCTPRNGLLSCPVYLFASLSTSSSVVLTTLS